MAVVYQVAYQSPSLLCEPDFQRRTVRCRPLPNRLTLLGIFGKRVAEARQGTEHSDKIALQVGRGLFLYDVE